ncbi:MAG: ASKHA domain-containing protein [Candidatus Marinimicrobia bacterium]|nr:ASKHA domain-containing protein [Candidatus Neomarinimicrobiota bacterium]
MTATIQFHPARGAARSCAAARAEPLTVAAETAGFPLDARCGGQGVCGRCRVELGPGEYEVDGKRICVPAGPRQEALAFRTWVASDQAVVFLPAGSQIEEEGHIVTDFVLSEQPPDPRITRHAATVPPPARHPPHCDVKRLGDVLPAPRPDATLEALRQLPAAFDDGGGPVQAVIARSADGARLLDVRPAAAAFSPLGLAVDVGTTTVVALLVELETGLILGRASRYNQQIRCAGDVASRITYASDPERLKTLQRLIVQDTLNPLIRAVTRHADRDPRDILHVAVAGNTVMMHLLLGVDPHSIGRVPFEPVFTAVPLWPAAALGLRVHPEAELECAPACSAYVGGDLTADLDICNLAARQGPTLLVDIGTNGEMILQHNGALYGCATAAGPAFEGAGISCGTRAAVGAVDHLQVSPDLEMDLHVLGDGRPTGLCGTALIDFLAAANAVGLLNACGRFDLDRLRTAGRYRTVEAEGRTLHACLLAPAAETAGGRDLLLSEADVAQLLKAKAALLAGAQTLLDVRGLEAAELKCLVLAGGFARYLDPRHAMAMGLLPRVPLERIEIIGNGSLAGAYRLLTDASAGPRLLHLARLPEIIELNHTPTFEDRFIDALQLPDPAETPHAS